MDRQILNFTANEQTLTVVNPMRISTNKVNYIEAHFELGQNWSGYDSVRAVWWNDFATIGTVLDSLGVCRVPQEVLRRKGPIMVNLVGSISDGEVLTDRLTTYPVKAGVVDANSRVSGDDPHPATPSQVEQFAAAVREDADRAEAGAAAAEESAQNASDSATSASNSAESAHDDKVAIEEAIAEVIQQIEDFEQVQVVVNTLPPSSQATSDFTDGILTLGIPQGVKGDTGNGIQSITKVSTSGLVDTYRITYTNGQTTTFTVTNGAKGDTGNGISSIAKTSTVGLVDTYTITYTDGNTSTFTVTNGEKGDKGDTGEVSLAQLESLMPVDSASGSIASFPDGQSVFGAKSVVAEINPVQDLHGYDKPWSGGSGKNKLNATPDIVKPLNTHGSWNGNVYTDNGVTFTVTDDGTITVNGTPTNTTYLELGNFSTGDNAYKINGFQGEYVNTATLTAIVGSTWYTVRDANGTEIPANTTVRVCLYLATGASLTNAVFKPMIRLASETDATYEPYSNICPISGWDEVNTMVFGTNVWDEEWELGGYNANGEKIVGSSRIRSKNKIPCIPNTTYYFACSGSYTAWVNFCWFDANEEIILNNTIAHVNNPFTSPSNAYYVVFNTSDGYGATYKGDISINYPSTDHDYHAFEGNDTYTTDLDRTVYGGTVDLVSGVLTVDRVKIILDGVTSHRKFAVVSLDSGSGKYYSRCTLDSSEVGINTSATNLTVRSDKFACSTSLAVGNCYITANGTYLICVLPQTITTVADANAWLASNTPMFVYELAEPQTYQLDPQTVATLKGQNNVWSDSGDTSVVYVADVQKYIEKKLS